MNKMEELKNVSCKETKTLRGGEKEMDKLPADSLEAYDEKYAKGYGLQYPDGHVIRFYERVLKHELKLTKGKILDFGCGNGIHSKYFMDHGFECYGVDIIPEAICQGQKFMGEHAVLIEPNQSLKKFFHKDQFDIVFANQSLYYMNNSDLKKCVDELYEFAKPGGICFFTMMSRLNCYANLIEEEYDNGLSKVVLKNRLRETTYINFVSNPEELEQIFRPFETLHIGCYDLFSFLSSEDEDGCSHHYIYIGTKK
ncbi:hypothetical protein C806_02765 [Lachnospiraceae bacterium 3-1]|nr:hypothetical protein C806_02765 [Lachnospiraceae bacterium 3-1]